MKDIICETKTLHKKVIKKDNFKDLLRHSERTAQKLWNNKEDKVWNNQ